MGVRGFSGKKFYAVAQPALDTTGNRNVMTCLVVLMMLCGVIVAIVLLLKPSTYQKAIATPVPVLATPDVPSVPVDRPGIAPCTQVNAECGSIATPSYKAVTGQTPVLRHAIASDERKAMAVVYPTSAPIPVADRECYYAEKYGVSCDDVKSATAQMLQWQAEEGR